MKTLAVASLLFALALPLHAAADLFVSTIPAATRIPAGSEMNLAFTLFNQGSETAKNVVVVFDFPADITLKRVYGAGTTCDYSKLPLRCTAGDIGALDSDPRSFTLTLAAPRKNATVVVTATVSSDTPEDNPTNNSVTRTFDVVEATNFYVETKPVTSRVDPGSLVVTRTTLSNFLDSDPTDVRIHFELANGTIEAIKPDPAWSCSFTSNSALCVASTINHDCRCGAPIELTVRTSPDRAGGVTELTASATSALPEFDPSYQHHGQASLQTYHWLTVTNTNDDGPGSLRQAINAANDGCELPACKIAFEIAEPVPTTGYFTIAPSYPLPPISGTRVSVDGTTQTLFTGDSNAKGPEVVLDGRFLGEGRGIEIHSKCEAIIQGVAVGNFPDHGVVFASDGTCNYNGIDERRVSGNYLGLDPTGATAWPNLRGVYAAGPSVDLRDNVISGNRRSGVWAESAFFGAHGNRIGVSADGNKPLPNGASGIYVTPQVGSAEVLLNTISYNGQMGVAVAREAKLIDIRQNAMKQNGGIGIDVGLDGRNAPLPDDRNTQSNAPLLLSATYDATKNSTMVTMTLTTGPLGPYFNQDHIDAYVNDEADGDGERWIGEGFGGAISNTSTFTISLPGDYRGKWLNATSTRVHYIAVVPPDRPTAKSITPQFVAGGDAKTSELSNSVLVQ